MIANSQAEANERLLDDFINLREDGRGLYNAIFKYVQNQLGGDYDTAEDVMIQTQLNAWSKRNTYDSFRKLQSWLFAIASHACIDYQRKNKRWINRVPLEKIAINNPNSEEDGFLGYDIEANDKSAYDKLVLQEDAEAIRKRVQCLPNKMREAIVLVYFEGRKYKEVAEELGIPVGTVNSRLNSGLKLLEELFEGRRSAA